MWKRSCARWARVLVVIAIAGCAARQGELREPKRGEIAELRYQFAESLVAEGNEELAAPYLRELLSADPRNARLHLLLGIVLREKGVYPAAEKELRQALRLRPNDPDNHAALGVLLLKMKRYAAAESAHRRAVELGPEQARHYNDLGFCLLVQRRLEEAKEVLEDAVRRDPSLRRAYNNLGFVLGLMGQDDQAQQAFAQAGSRAMVWTNMGYLAELRGQPTRAAQYYEKALRVERSYPPALSNLRRLDPARYGSVPEEPGEPQEQTSHITGATEEMRDAEKDKPRSAGPAEGGATELAPPASYDDTRDSSTGGDERLPQGPAPRR